MKGRGWPGGLKATIDHLAADRDAWKRRAEGAEKAIQKSLDMPTSLANHAEDWLKSNQKTPEQVRYGLFPLGMVQRWIERAEAAEKELSQVKRGLEAYLRIEP